MLKPSATNGCTIHAIIRKMCGATRFEAAMGQVNFEHWERYKQYTSWVNMSLETEFTEQKTILNISSVAISFVFKLIDFENWSL